MDPASALTSGTGTVHAQLVIGAPQRLSLPTWWLSVLSICLMTGCVVLPPTAEAPVDLTPFLTVLRASPEQYKPHTIADPNSGEAFRIEQVATQQVDESALHYYWYYDWDGSSTVLDISAVCQSHLTCTVVVCDRPGNTKKEHKLLAVVSSAALVDGAVQPTDFPTNTVYDTVQWQLVNEKTCVTAP